MAYTEFDRTVPVITDTRQEVVDDSRYNLNALFDALLIGDFPGYNYTLATEDGDGNPTNIYLKNGNDWVRSDIEYNTDGNAATISCFYSDDGGSTWVTIGDRHWSYNVSGNAATSSWTAY